MGRYVGRVSWWGVRGKEGKGRVAGLDLVGWVVGFVFFSGQSLIRQVVVCVSQKHASDQSRWVVMTLAFTLTEHGV